MYAGTYFENSVAQILGKSFCCVQEHTSKIQWRRYSGNPPVDWQAILCKFSGSDTRDMLLLYAGSYLDGSVAQMLGKSFCCMQEHTSKIEWLRHSGNLSAVCKSMFLKFSGSDALEILMLCAGAYFENSMAQILVKSFRWL